MDRVTRVLPDEPFTRLEDYVASGGGEGLRAARRVEPDVVIDELVASGLRGRGGAGFPTGVKWQTVRSYASSELATSVVVNAAEGEPGTYKDRAILAANPYAVLEGALIAAAVLGARSITIATKATFVDVVSRLNAAVAELQSAGWTKDVDITVHEGPAAYLYGEETAMLEVLDGRSPFPRIAPPYRRGMVEVVETDEDVDSESGLSADVEMAMPDQGNVVPPTLVNNVETMANIPAIVAKGAAWFREVGTKESPGSVVCTVSGDVPAGGVIEVAMGTPLSVVLSLVGRPPGANAPAVTAQPEAIMLGVSSGVLDASHLDIPISHEAFRTAGTGLGSAGFIVVGRGTDAIALAAGASRFLAVESCGQCTPCKQDGLEIASRLAFVAAGSATADDLEVIHHRLATIADGARCSLASQHQAVVQSLLDAFPTGLVDHLSQSVPAAEPILVAELVGFTEGVGDLDPTFSSKQPDWTFDAEDSGSTPVELASDHRRGTPRDASRRNP